MTKNITATEAQARIDHYNVTKGAELDQFLQQRAERLAMIGVKFIVRQYIDAVIIDALCSEWGRPMPQ